MTDLDLDSKSDLITSLVLAHTKNIKINIIVNINININININNNK